MAGWTAPRTWVAGEKPSAATMNAHIRDNLLALNGFVRKTADEPVTSSAVLQNDNELSYAVVAGTYVIDWFLIGTSATNAAGDIQFAWTFPTASVATAMGNAPDISLASSGVSTGQWSANAGIVSGTFFNRYGLSTNNISIWLHTLFVFTASGTVQLQWAQDVSNASASTLKAGSHMVVKQVA